MAVLRVRDVPKDTRNALELEARRRGQTLEEYLLVVLERWAGFSRNREIIAEVERDLAAGGGAGPDTPDAADLIRAARAERDADIYCALTGEAPPDST